MQSNMGSLNLIKSLKVSKMSCDASFRLAQTQELAQIPTKEKTMESKSSDQIHLGITVKPFACPLDLHCAQKEQ